ncbi:MAG: helix-turn-helix transcriptional regulator [Chloroflexota bacterium]
MLDSGSRRQTQSISLPSEPADFESEGGSLSGLETGAILRERREAMGVGLDEVEAATRIRQKYLAAMESDEWHLLPGEIVGRGFLRNYAAYLDLEPSEMLERRRAALEPRLASALRNTSAGSALPPTREVNYNPKELDLKDEPEGIDTPSLNFRRIVPILLLALFAYVLWQGFDLIQGVASSVANGIQTRVAELRVTPEPSDASQGGILGEVPSSENGLSDAQSPGDELVSNNGAGSNGSPQNSLDNNNELNESPTETATTIPPTPLPTAVPPTLTPTDVPLAPTPTAIPPTPLPTAIPPTPLPTPEPPTPEPVVSTPFCPDSRSILSSPGEGQVVSGLVEISGSATHEAFQFYKLEYAPGSNASGGWAYFDGANSPVTQGRLGALDTRSLANGVYSIQLVVVDLSANFPDPCRVNITIQN